MIENTEQTPETPKSLTSPLKVKKPRSKLTLKQEGFVRDFLETKNATEAVRRNYNVKDDNSASSIAVQNLGKVTIQEKIQGLKDKMVDDSYILYGKQQQILERVEIRNPELANKIINKVLDRAGFMPIHKQESKSLKAQFVITRGTETLDDPNINSTPTTPVIEE